MTNTSNRVSNNADSAEPERACAQRLDTRDAELGTGLTIRRALPHQERKMIGAWCFLDHFGPMPIGPDDPGMRVGPHPHIGLQTVTWPIEGEIYHRDSLGNEQLIRPGQLNVMTAGRGISHSEETPPEHSASLHGAQLWIALPPASEGIEPAFDHHAELPQIRRGDFTITVLVGDMLGERSPAMVYTPLVGLDIVGIDPGTLELPLNDAFEYGVLVLEGDVEIAGEMIEPGTLLYLGLGRDSLKIESQPNCRLLILGGEPFAPQPTLWWNFVAQDRQTITQAKADWDAGHQRYGDVVGYTGDRLAAPELPWT